MSVQELHHTRTLARSKRHDIVLDHACNQPGMHLLHYNRLGSSIHTINHYFGMRGWNLNLLSPVIDTI